MKQTAQMEQVPKMNREQRRAAKHRKPQKPQYRGDPLAAPKLINMVQPFEPGELIANHNETKIAFERLRTGCGTGDDFNRVSMTFNIGLVISERIDPSLVDIMIRGQASMVRMLDRYNRGLSLGFDAAGLVDVPAAINAYEDIADTQSAMQITQAVREAYRRFDEGNVLTAAWANELKEGVK